MSMLIILQARYLPESLDVWKSKPDEFFPQKNDWYAEDQVKSYEDAPISSDPSESVELYESSPLSNDGSFNSQSDGLDDSLTDFSFNVNLSIDEDINSSVDETVETPVDIVELENASSLQMVVLGNVPLRSEGEESGKCSVDGDNCQRDVIIPDPHLKLQDESLNPLLDDIENYESKDFEIINHIQILRVAQKSSTTNTTNNNNDQPIRRPLSQEFCYRIFADATSEVQDVDVSMTFFVKSTYKIHVVRTEEMEIVEVLQKKSASVDSVVRRSSDWTVEVAHTPFTEQFQERSVKKVVQLELWWNPTVVQRLPEPEQQEQQQQQQQQQLKPSLSTEVVDPKIAFAPDTDFEKFHDFYFPDAPVAWV